MIELLRNSERRFVQRERHAVWHSLGVASRAADFGGVCDAVLAFDEQRLEANASMEQRFEDEVELVTYIYEGALSQEDTSGDSGVLHTGEFQSMSTGRRMQHKETSVARSDGVQLFRIWLRPAQAGLARAHEQKRFTEAQRRNRLCVVVSPDGRQGSLRVHQDALLFSAILDPGQHLVHELLPGRSVLLHAVRGEAVFNDIVLTQGDGMTVTSERSLALTVLEQTEILVLDLGPSHRKPWERRQHGDEFGEPRSGSADGSTRWSRAESVRAQGTHIREDFE